MEWISAFFGNAFIHFSPHFSLHFSPSLSTSLICQKSELLSSEFTQNSLCGAPQGGEFPRRPPGPCASRCLDRARPVHTPWEHRPGTSVAREEHDLLRAETVPTPGEHAPGTRTARHEQKSFCAEAVLTPGSSFPAQKFPCLCSAPRRKSPWLRTWAD